MARRLLLALLALLPFARLFAPPARVVLPDGRGAVVVARLRADSVRELARQLAADLRGDLDRHDLAVRAALARARASRPAV